MSDLTTLVAQDRATAGKVSAKALRRDGRVPAVVYGEGKDQLMISLEARALRRELHNPRFHSTLCTLDLGGKEMRVLPREIQLDPVTDEPIHADFAYVSKGATVTVEVAVEFLNEDSCPGLKRGGVLNVVRREVELICPADSIPEKIELDLAGADIGDSIHYSHAIVPDNVEPTITDRDFTIATIAAPSGGADEEEEAAEDRSEEETAETPAEDEASEEE